MTRGLPNFADVPTGQELAPDAAARALVQYAETAVPYGAAVRHRRPICRAERAMALQEAFMAMTTDEAFLEDAAKLNLDMSPIDGDAVRDMHGPFGDDSQGGRRALQQIVSTRSSAR